MKESLWNKISTYKVWIFLSLFSLAGLVGFGFQQIHLQNTPKIPELKEPAPLKVPREYNPSDALLDLKIERDRERSQEKERVQELLDQGGLGDETRKQAEQELWRLTQTSAKEQELETLLKAKGYQESMVAINPKIVTVVITGTMDSARAEAIGNMIANVTGYNLEQIEIVEK